MAGNATAHKRPRTCMFGNQCHVEWAIACLCMPFYSHHHLVFGYNRYSTKHPLLWGLRFDCQLRKHFQSSPRSCEAWSDAVCVDQRHSDLSQRAQATLFPSRSWYLNPRSIAAGMKFQLVALDGNGADIVWSCRHTGGRVLEIFTPGVAIRQLPGTKLRVTVVAASLMWSRREACMVMCTAPGIGKSGGRRWARS